MSAPNTSVGRGVSPLRTPNWNEVREQLAKLLANRVFARSRRMTRFLSFTIEHTLAGTADQVKEYLVGVEVFDRKPDYDPRVDPIVRVEARRLRAKLKVYYASAGRNDAVIVEYPKGSYVPVFRQRRTTRPAALRPRTEPVSEQATLVVLPFGNLTPDAGDDYFADGLAEELIHLLTRVKGLRVVAWQSAVQLRGQDTDLRRIRERLKASAILKGTVRRTSARVRVTVQLIDTGSGAILWSEKFDREMSDVFAIQEEIAGAIASTLRLTLGTKKATAPPSVSNLESYNLCLQGRFHANKRTMEGLRKSIECFTEAIVLEPGSPVAHAGLADSYSLSCDYGLLHPSEAMPRAEMAANKALELDSHSAEALCALAFIRSAFHWKWSEGETIYRRAIALNPGYARARHWLAVDHLAMSRRFEEALSEAQVAQQLDPLSLIVHEGHGYIHLLMRNFEIALGLFRRITELDPTFAKGWASMARALSLMGRHEEAIRLYEKSIAMTGATPNLLGAIGQVHAEAGNLEAAQECWDRLCTMATTRYVPATSFAILSLGMKQFSRSLDYLEEGAETHQLSIISVGAHPLYDPLRGEPRFQKLLATIGFAA